MDFSRKENRAPIAERMAELRKQSGRTQQECADALGVGQPTYHAMENAEQRFRRRDLVTLAVLYGMTLEEAFPEAGAAEPVAA